MSKKGVFLGIIGLAVLGLLLIVGFSSDQKADQEEAEVKPEKPQKIVNPKKVFGEAPVYVFYGSIISLDSGLIEARSRFDQKSQIKTNETTDFLEKDSQDSGQSSQKIAFQDLSPGDKIVVFPQKKEDLRQKTSFSARMIIVRKKPNNG